MIPGRRRPEPSPGDLYLDPAVPAGERLVLCCGALSVQATHVWTGTGWSRLRLDVVRPVPAALALSPAAGPA